MNSCLTVNYLSSPLQWSRVLLILKSQILILSSKIELCAVAVGTNIKEKVRHSFVCLKFCCKCWQSGWFVHLLKMPVSPVLTNIGLKPHMAHLGLCLFITETQSILYKSDLSIIKKIKCQLIFLLTFFLTNEHAEVSWYNLTMDGWMQYNIVSLHHGLLSSCRWRC